jgi:hypothetical protein
MLGYNLHEESNYTNICNNRGSNSESCDHIVFKYFTHALLKYST